MAIRPKLGRNLKPRMDSDKTPINGESLRQRKLPEAAESVALALEENVVWRFSDGARSVFEVVRRPFEDLGWALQRALLGPPRTASKSSTVAVADLSPAAASPSSRSASPA